MKPRKRSGGKAPGKSRGKDKSRVLTLTYSKSERKPTRRSAEYSEQEEESEDFPESFEEPKGALRATRKKAVSDAFTSLWASLFSSPVHLDSALSKQPKHLKSILAQIAPLILLRPASIAEALGVGMAPEEPWNLAQDQLKGWRSARLMAESLYSLMTGGGIEAQPSLSDFPPSMVEEWVQTWGKEAAHELAFALATEAPLSLRATRKLGAEGLLKELSSGASRVGVKVTRSDLSPMGVRLASYAPVLSSPWYEKGGFEIQDEGSQVMAFFALWPELFAPLLRSTPGSVPKLGKVPEMPEQTPVLTVVDACAGAGGKSLAFADALKGKGRIYAYDTSERKLQALRRRATRAGVNNIQAVAIEPGKESETVARFAGKADVVLVDAPCSGWGVLRRNPDIKWRQSPEALKRMPEIQKYVLEQYSKLVVPGGRLVYGVCTFRRDETRAIVEEFLRNHPEFEAREGGYLGPGPTDGFFMQRLERKKQ